MISEKEREAWAVSYRLYEKYSELLRSAAENSADASEIFLCVVRQLQEKWSLYTDRERVILLNGYLLLDEVYTRAKK